MKEPCIEKIECPSCGQHYSIELTDKEQDVTCSVCNAVFTAARIDEDAPSSPTPPQRTHQTKALPRPTLASVTRSSASGSILDRFMGLLFRFGKTFAGLLAVLCLLSIFASIGFFVWNLRTSMEIPTYMEIASMVSENDTDAPVSTESLDERRAIEKKFGDRVVEIIKEHKFVQEDYDELIELIQDIEENNRSKYLKGLETALEDRNAAARNSKGEILPVLHVARLFTAFFTEAEDEQAARKEEAKTNRYAALGAVFVSCFMLFMMLIIPALLRIEENTRRVA
jgi:hypothetical protein